jgi:hypothetical protein
MISQEGCWSGVRVGSGGSQPTVASSGIRYGSHHQQQQKYSRYDEFDLASWFYIEFIGAKKHLVTGLSSYIGPPQRSKFLIS